MTAGSRSYQLWIAQKRQACKKFGYRFICFDLGGLDLEGTIEFPVEPLQRYGPRSPWKPDLIIEAVTNHWDGSVMAWLDGDTELLGRLPALSMSTPASPLGVTLHELGDDDRARGYKGPYAINAGVIFFGPDKDFTLTFCAAWRDCIESLESGSDQDALNALLYEDGYFGIPGGGKLLQVYSSETYNNTETRKGARVYHHQGPKTRDLVIESDHVS